jgi:hypothetical protein
MPVEAFRYSTREAGFDAAALGIWASVASASA